MLQGLQVYIDKENIDVLSMILQRYRGLLEGDIVGPLQVQNVEQQLLSGRALLLNDQQDVLMSLDQFKLEIGVPMSLSIEMDDSVLRPLIQTVQAIRAQIIEEEQAKARGRGTRSLSPSDQAAAVRARALRLAAAFDLRK